jgi:hypothetical protein
LSAGDLCQPSGPLTRARPKARPDGRAANLRGRIQQLPTLSWPSSNGPWDDTGVALTGTILTAISAVAALVTVWLAYMALSQARETLNEAKTARLDAEQAAKFAAIERRATAEDRHLAAVDRHEAAADRREAEYDRERRRLERVGQMVEDLFWAADLARRGGQVAAASWMSQRNVLRHVLVGLHNRLPAAADLLNSASPDQAFGPASRARQEIERELEKLERAAFFNAALEQAAAERGLPPYSKYEPRE